MGQPVVQRRKKRGFIIDALRLPERKATQDTRLFVVLVVCHSGHPGSKSRKNHVASRRGESGLNNLLYACRKSTFTLDWKQRPYGKFFFKWVNSFSPAAIVFIIAFYICHCPLNRFVSRKFKPCSFFNSYTAKTKSFASLHQWRRAKQII